MKQDQKLLNSALWVVQVLLAIGFIAGGAMKLFMPVNKLAVMWPWAADVPFAILRFMGVVDALAAVGIVLPSIFRIIPKLVPITALCIIILMLSAAIFHFYRGEAASTPINFMFAFMAAFVVWGRFKKCDVI